MSPVRVTANAAVTSHLPEKSSSTTRTANNKFEKGKPWTINANFLLPVSIFPHFTVPSNGKFPHLLRILLPVLAVA